MTDNQDHILTIRNSYEKVNREVAYSLDQMQRSSERKNVRGWIIYFKVGLNHVLKIG